ncbi:MAG: hypothetical protein AAF993_06200 [Pseudomonadota bacterium]
MINIRDIDQELSNEALNKVVGAMSFGKIVVKRSDGGMTSATMTIKFKHGTYKYTRIKDENDGSHNHWSGAVRV